MPRTMEVTVYRLNELSPKARQRAIEKEQQYLGESLDAERITEFFADRLKELGLPYDDIQWSLSSSQGDGVAFYGQVDFDEWFKKNNNRLVEPHRSLIRRMKDSINIQIFPRSEGRRYHHWNSMRVEIEAESDRPLTTRQKAALTAVEKAISDQAKDVSRELEKYGYAEIDDQTSERAAIESIEANEFEFDEHGDKV